MRDAKRLAAIRKLPCMRYVFIEVGLIFLPILLDVVRQRGGYGSPKRACKNIYSSSSCMP